MNLASSPTWASRRWSAKSDKLCPAPRSDDYNDWSLMQLKREITQRQLKTNPRRRNKEAFVAILLQDDASNSQNQPPVGEVRTPVSTSKSHLESNFLLDQREMVVTQSPGVAMAPQVSSPPACVELETPSRPQKKQKMDDMGSKLSADYWNRKLGLDAAKLELESRRLDLETQREQRSSELHAVQLALAQEQLQQAKLNTQKMRSEWMVEQLLHKKRLRDAGVSQEETANIGLF